MDADSTRMDAEEILRKSAFGQRKSADLSDNDLSDVAKKEEFIK